MDCDCDQINYIKGRYFATFTSTTTNSIHKPEK